jgi:hypothetical protein
MIVVTSDWPGCDQGTTNSTSITSSSYMIWIPVQPPNPTDPERGESAQDALDRTAAEKLTPSSSVLREIARRSMPPQEWWDEDFGGL